MCNSSFPSKKGSFWHWVSDPGVHRSKVPNSFVPYLLSEQAPLCNHKAINLSSNLSLYLYIDQGSTVSEDTILPEGTRHKLQNQNLSLWLSTHQSHFTDFAVSLSHQRHTHGLSHSHIDRGKSIQSRNTPELLILHQYKIWYEFVICRWEISALRICQCFW